MTLAAAYLLFVSIAPLAPRDEPQRVDLQWIAPSSCPDEAAVHEAIEALLSPGTSRQKPPSIEARVEASGAIWQLTLRVESVDGQQERELYAARCDSLVHAVALEVALLLEAEEIAAAPIEGAPAEAEPSPRVGSKPASEVELEVQVQVQPPPATNTDPSSPGVRWRIRGGALVGMGMAADTFAAPTVGAALLLRRVAFDLDLGHWPGGFAEIPGQQGRGSRLSTSSVVADGCARWERGPFAFAMCGGLELGVLHARGAAIERARAAVQPLAAVVVLPRVELRLSRLVSVSVAPWARFAWIRPGVRVEGVGEVFRVAPWGVGGAIRLEVEFPGRKRRGRDITGSEPTP